MIEEKGVTMKTRKFESTKFFEFSWFNLQSITLPNSLTLNSQFSIFNFLFGSVWCRWFGFFKSLVSHQPLTPYHYPLLYMVAPTNDEKRITYGAQSIKLRRKNENRN